MKSIPALAGSLVALVCALASEVRADEPVVPRSTEQCIADHVAGQELRLEGRFGAAADRLKQCLHPSCSALLREDCASLLRAVEQEAPSVVLAASDGTHDLVEVTVRLDQRVLTTRLDGRPLPLDAGPVALTFEAPGMRPVTQRVVIRAGERHRLVAVRLSPALDAPPIPARPAVEQEIREPRASRLGRTDRALLATSVALGALGTGLAFGAQHAFDEAERDCKPACSGAERQRIDRMAYAADGLFLAAAVTLVVTVVRIALPGRRTPKAKGKLGPSQLRAEVSF